MSLAISGGNLFVPGFVDRYWFLTVLIKGIDGEVDLITTCEVFGPFAGANDDESIFGGDTALITWPKGEASSVTDDPLLSRSNRPPVAKSRAPARPLNIPLVFLHHL